MLFCKAIIVTKKIQNVIYRIISHQIDLWEKILMSLAILHPHPQLQVRHCLNIRSFKLIPIPTNVVLLPRPRLSMPANKINKNFFLYTKEPNVLRVRRPLLRLLLAMVVHLFSSLLLKQQQQLVHILFLYAMALEHWCKFDNCEIYCPQSFDY
jgi:hypothetical protein